MKKLQCNAINATTKKCKNSKVNEDKNNAKKKKKKRKKRKLFGTAYQITIIFLKKNKNQTS
jgi:hypothetical protein